MVFSGGFGHTVGKTIAMGYLSAEDSQAADGYAVGLNALYSRRHSSISTWASFKGIENLTISMTSIHDASVL